MNLSEEEEKEVRQAVNEQVELTAYSLKLALEQDVLFDLNAQAVWKHYHAYQKAGFSAAQALQLTAATIPSMNKK